MNTLEIVHADPKSSESCQPVAVFAERASRAPVEDLERLPQTDALVLDPDEPASRSGAEDLLIVPGKSGPPPRQSVTTLRPIPEAQLDAALLSQFERGGPDLYARLEAVIILRAYEFCDRNQIRTASLLGISRNVLRARLAKLGIIAARGANRRSCAVAHSAPDAEESRTARESQGRADGCGGR